MSDDSEVLKALEKRVAALEADRDRFLKALEQAATMCLKVPMVAGIIPKEVKQRLQEIANASKTSN